MIVIEGTRGDVPRRPSTLMPSPGRPVTVGWDTVITNSTLPAADLVTCYAAEHHVLPLRWWRGGQGLDVRHEADADDAVAE